MRYEIYYDHHRREVNDLVLDGYKRISLGDRILNDAEMQLIVVHRALHAAGVVDCRKPQENAMHEAVAESWRDFKKKLEGEIGKEIVEYKEL